MAGRVLAMITHHNDDPTTARTPLLHLDKFLKEKVDVENTHRTNLIAVLDQFLVLVRTDPERNAATEKRSTQSVFSSKASFFNATVHKVLSFSPIEFLATATLIYRHANRSNDMLREDIKAMRKFIRQSHRDLRTNPSVFATAWYFIVTEMRKRVAGDYSGDIGDDAPAAAAENRVQNQDGDAVDEADANVNNGMEGVVIEEGHVAQSDDDESKLSELDDALFADDGELEDDESQNGVLTEEELEIEDEEMPDA